ncbi:MAG: hypothetical protein HYV36_04950 [Lentisphaerae bacterium]|nr:hypothetical protein [Lentisphaerota bacterium]
MAWVQPVMKAAGLYAVMDMESRAEPHCVFRVFKDRSLARACARRARLLARPYARRNHVKAGYARNPLSNTISNIQQGISNNQVKRIADNV